MPSGCFFIPAGMAVSRAGSSNSDHLGRPFVFSRSTPAVGRNSVRGPLIADASGTPLRVRIQEITKPGVVVAIAPRPPAIGCYPFRIFSPNWHPPEGRNYERITKPPRLEGGNPGGADHGWSVESLQKDHSLTLARDGRYQSRKSNALAHGRWRLTRLMEPRWGSESFLSPPRMARKRATLGFGKKRR
jgi:hypothetical protein